MSITLNHHLYSHPKVAETKTCMMLMGNRYQKHSLKTVSMIGDNFNGINVSDNMLNTKECMFINTTVRQGLRHHNFGIYKDPYIENRYYTIVNGHHGDVNAAYSYLCVMHEKDNDSTVIGTIATQNIDWYCIADVDKAYIYAIGKHVNGSGSYIYRLNKFTYTFTSTIYYANPSARTIANCIYKDETYLYFIMRHVNSTWYLIRYNKSNNEVKNKTINSGTLTWETEDSKISSLPQNNVNLFPQNGIVIHENFYQHNGRYYFFMPQRNGNSVVGSGPANQNMIAFVFDPSVAWEDTNFYIKTLDIYNEHLTWLPLNGYNTYRFWVRDNKYLYYAIYDESNNYPTGIPIQGIHKFEIVDDGNLVWKSVNRINTDKQIISMIFDNKKDRIVIGYMGSCDIMRFNQVTKEYELTNKEITNVQSIGFDEYDRLWIMHTDTSVHVYTLEDPQEVDIHFEHIYYAYGNDDIESYVEFEALSFSNERATGYYLFELTGPSYFKANNQQKITILYQNEILRIPVVITGDSRVSCKAIYLGKDWSP